MTPISKDRVSRLLKDFRYPGLADDLVSAGMVREVGVSGNDVFVHLTLPAGLWQSREKIRESLGKLLRSLPGMASMTVQCSQSGAEAVSRPESSPLGLEGVANLIAVGSGKGGVGKTTVAVNLAVALMRSGSRVGLMDGDIYGPNVPLMLGAGHDARPQVLSGGEIAPVEIQGLKMISMGILVPAGQPMIWRGPMLHSAISQFLRQVAWGKLDYLIVDLPPGTGDVQLSLVQNAPVSGAVIVTTPQEAALLDVRKAIAMFQATGVPVLGVVENMAGDIFGSGGGEKIAAELKVPFLGRILLDARIREGGDNGRPVTAFSKDLPAAEQFMTMARALSQVSNPIALQGG